jgi:hypothetical protein
MFTAIIACSVHKIHAGKLRQDGVHLLVVVTATSINRSTCPRVEYEHQSLHALLEIGVIPRDVCGAAGTTLRQLVGALEDAILQNELNNVNIF